MGVGIEFDGTVAVVRLEWPESRNSLDAPRAVELQEALAEAQSLPRCRAIVLAGDASTFCSGGDLRFFLGVVGETEEYVRGLIASVYQPLVTLIVQSPVPVLAAVDGPAIGLGMDLALACDLCFVGPRGWLMQGWARAGLIAGAGGTLFLRRQLPRHRVWQLIVDQERLSPHDVHELGLGLDTGEQSAEAAAHDFAARLAGLPVDTVAGYKRLMQGLEDALPAHLEQAQALQAALLTSPAFVDRARDIVGRTAPAARDRD